MNHKTALSVFAAGLISASWTGATRAQGSGTLLNTATEGFPQNVAMVPAPPSQCRKVAPGAIPAPAGTYMRQWEAQETAKAALDGFVIYGNEWYLGGLEPGPYGRWHPDQLAKRLPAAPFQVVIQPDISPTCTESRRLFVVQYLVGHGVADAAQRVVVAFPQAEGLYGEEAARAYLGMSSGQGGTAGGYGGAGFGTGGLGGLAPSGGVGGSLGGAGGLGLGGGGLGGMGGLP